MHLNPTGKIWPEKEKIGTLKKKRKKNETKRGRKEERQEGRIEERKEGRKEGGRKDRKAKRVR